MLWETLLTCCIYFFTTLLFSITKRSLPITGSAHGSKSLRIFPSVVRWAQGSCRIWLHLGARKKWLLSSIVSKSQVFKTLDGWIHGQGAHRAVGWPPVPWLPWPGTGCVPFQRRQHELRGGAFLSVILTSLLAVILWTLRNISVYR